MGLYQNRIVVKVGTSTLTNEMGQTNLRAFDCLACVLADVRNMGYEVILVSSGAIAVGTSRLVIFSDIDGLYEHDPRLYPDTRLLERIENIDDSVFALAGGVGSRRGTGGMRTKLQAASLATSWGIDTTITNGKQPQVLYDIIKGGHAGTLFIGKDGT